MSVEAHLRAAISKLEEALEDAAKIDKGKSGQPGTRVRKVAQEVKSDLDEVRKMVLEARKSE
jgi:hypothetical protein